MKAVLCLLVLVASACAVEEKKTEKRGVLGLGYGLGHAAPLIGHGAPLIGHGAPLIGHGGYAGYGGSYYGHGLGLYSGISHAGYGHGLYGGYAGYGHGLSSGLYGNGLLGHGGLVASAPIVSHAPYYGSPLLGLGHGWH